MSSYLVALVWGASPMSATERLIMLAMADAANNYGETAPHLEDIMHTTQCSKRTVRGVLGEYRKSGLLELQSRARDNMPPRYKINILKLQEMQKQIVDDEDETSEASSLGYESAGKAQTSNIYIKDLNDVNVRDDARTTEKHSWFPVANAIAEVCRMDLAKNNSRIFREAKLLGKDVTPADVLERFGPSGWWYTYDWRGKKGQVPGIHDIRTVWGMWDKHEKTDREKFDEEMASDEKDDNIRR